MYTGSLYPAVSASTLKTNTATLWFLTYMGTTALH